MGFDGERLSLSSPLGLTVQGGAPVVLMALCSFGSGDIKGLSKPLLADRQLLCADFVLTSGCDHNNKTHKGSIRLNDEPLVLQPCGNCTPRCF